MVGATPAAIGAMEALEVLKNATKVGATLRGRPVHRDFESTAFLGVRLNRDSACPACGSSRPSAPTRATVPTPVHTFQEVEA